MNYTGSPSTASVPMHKLKFSACSNEKSMAESGRPLLYQNSQKHRWLSVTVIFILCRVLIHFLSQDILENTCDPGSIFICASLLRSRCGFRVCRTFSAAVATRADHSVLHSLAARPYQFELLYLCVSFAFCRLWCMFECCVFWNVF